MKRVNFGHKGGFPLEQETLIHLQRAYANDMLEALMAHWGIDPTQNYRIKQATSDTDDGWIITTITREEIDAELGTPYTVTKPELIRLKFNGGAKRSIEILDVRAEFLPDGSPDTSGDGYLEYADGQPKRVYEEWLGQYVNSPTRPENKIITNLIPLKTIIELTTDVSNINADIDLIKEDYLPRDGSKPMTGDLNLGPNQISKLDTNESFSAIVRAADFNLGYSGRRGQVYPDRPIGRALVDGGDTLNLNYSQDWEKTKIFGDINLPNLQQINVTQEKPLVLSSNGDLKVSNENIITPPNATTSTAGIAEIATQTEVNTGTDNSRIVTPRALRNFMFSNFRVTSGMVTTGNRRSGVNAVNFFNDFTVNRAYVFPPSGYTINNLRGFMASIANIDFGGDVNGDDTFYCRHRVDRTNGRVIVIGQNTENRAVSRINYLAIWQK